MTLTRDHFQNFDKLTDPWGIFLDADSDSLDLKRGFWFCISGKLPGVSGVGVAAVPIVLKLWVWTVIARKLVRNANSQAHCRCTKPEAPVVVPHILCFSTPSLSDSDVRPRLRSPAPEKLSLTLLRLRMTWCVGQKGKPTDSDPEWLCMCLGVMVRKTKYLHFPKQHSR